MSRREKPRSKKRWFLRISVGALCVYLLVASWWWYTWPDRAWNAFTRALSERDVVAANRLCDSDTLRLGLDSTGKLVLYVDVDGIYFPLESMYRGNLNSFRDQSGPTRSRLWQIVTAEMPVTNQGAIWYGSLHFQRGHIGFRSDREPSEEVVP